MARYNSIFAKLLAQGDYKGYPLADGTTVMPGQGLETVMQDGEAHAQPVSTAGANATLIAREARNPPKMGDGDPTDQPYETANVNVETRQFTTAEQARLRLAAGSDLGTAADANVSVGDALGWTANGNLSKGVSTTPYEAVEAFDNSQAAAGETALVTVRQQE